MANRFTIRFPAIRQTTPTYKKIANRAVKHPALRVLHKCENLICAQVGLLRLGLGPGSRKPGLPADRHQK
ncbi:hypothetical protein OUZ56_017068 [Daphnia magna]|uniref:Tfiih basal transcription factor complex p44 subunit n=1 Tax=Daphnia magna TaxID=35525 RepID=A0ABR0ASJ2_9CRUS|nr:hypothetical protein OUZ56_017068 [Daphnia magna]